MLGHEEAIRSALWYGAFCSGSSFVVALLHPCNSFASSSAGHELCTHTTHPDAFPTILPRAREGRRGACCTLRLTLEAPLPTYAFSTIEKAPRVWRRSLRRSLPGATRKQRSAHSS